MPTVRVNSVNLHYRISGSGDIPLVLVHGSWDSHRDWDALLPYLSGPFRILSYDRRGHSRSERPAGPGSVREDVDDLAGLIQVLDLGPAWVVGNSFGASIALRLAGQQPELLRGLIAHEPPLFGLLGDEPELAPVLEDAARHIGAVVERVAAGDHAGAAEQFVETVALGPGGWSQVPAWMREVFIENAPTFLDEARDPDQLVFELDGVRHFHRPALLTLGGRSPPMFAPVVRRLARALPRVTVQGFEEAGHVPHSTHPRAYAAAILAFIRRHSRLRPRRRFGVRKTGT